MSPFNEEDQVKAQELLQKKSGTEDVLAELTVLAQAEKIEKSEIPDIIRALQTTVDALKKLLSPESSESAIASEWVKTIKDNGVAMMHGKLHPYWFSQDQDHLPPQPIYEPGYEDFGHINVDKPPKTNGVSPNGDILSGISSTTKVLIRNFNTQYLVLSQSINPNFQPDENLMKEMSRLEWEGGIGNPDITPEMKTQQKLYAYARYCQNTLNGKFNEPLREISFMCWADSNQTKVGLEQKDMVGWRGKNEPIPVELNIFLSPELAKELYNQMQANPNALQALIKELYPKTAGEYPLIIMKGENIVFVQDADPLKDSVTELMKSSPSAKLS